VTAAGLARLLGASVAGVLAALVLAGALGRASGEEAGPEVGRPAPDFTLPDLAGNPVRLADYQGKKGVLVNFWATWCVPCREELPSLERLHRRRQGTLEVLAVSLDTASPAKVRAFARELGLSFLILSDRELALARMYRVRVVPMSFIVDRTGVIRYRELGYRNWTEPESESIVEEALRPR
jgi:cytochrome c biogenesis protein CcmG/thiol:disulfide interchange protein DsbE